jgi:hypothetical protein
MFRLRRWFWVCLFGVLPFTRRWLWKPHDGEYRYYCWCCNQYSADRPGYSGYLTRYRELCRACWERRRRWHPLRWLETGEVVTAPAVDGDGVISPSTRRASYSYRVYRLFGFEFVAAAALRRSAESIRNAEYWFDRLGVSGNAEQVARIRQMGEVRRA